MWVKRLYIVFWGLLITTWSFGQYHAISSGDYTSCGGVFVDSGNATGNYGPNENYTITLCPDGSSGTHLKISFSGVDIPFGDELCFFDGSNTLAPSLGCASSFLPGAPFIIQASPLNAGGCITVTFNSNASGQGKGWLGAISCVPACQAFTAIISSSDPVPSPADTGWIDICPNQTVSFEGSANFIQNNILYNQQLSQCTLEWDFGDGNLKTGITVENDYKLPGGYKVNLTITDQYGCRNTNVLSRKVRVAPHPIISIANLPGPVCMNDTLSLSADDLANGSHQISVIPQEARFELTKTRADSLPLPDGNGATYQTSVLFNEFAPDRTLTDPAQIISICANMEHSWMRDLRITLTCPSGQSVVLVNQEETGEEVFLGNPFENDELLPDPIPGDGFTYCWNVNAPNGTWLEYANQFTPQTLPENSYKTFESLDNLLGCPLNGEWILTIQDLWAIDNGFIFWWNITFDEALLPNIETFTPTITDLSWRNQPNIILYKDQDIQAIADKAGEAFFLLTYTDNFNCASDTFVTIPVLPLTHPSCLDCNQLIAISADTAVCEGATVKLESQISGFAGGVIPFAHYPMVPLGYSTNPPANPYRAPINVTNIYPDLLINTSATLESVCFTLETNPVNNIAVFLESPDGKLLELTSYNGSTGQDYINTCFTPVAGQSIQSGTAPFTGNYQPEGSWTDLDGSPVNGQWNLIVSDNFGLSRLGLLDHWTITFNATNDFTYNWSPTPAVLCVDCPTTEIITDTSRTYQLSVSDEYGCLAFRGVQVDINPIYGAPTVYCGESTSTQLIINWDPISNAPGYEININGNGWIPVNGSLSHSISGLINGTYVTIQLRVSGFSPDCPAEITTLECRYLFCQMYAVVEDSVPPSCFGGNDGEAYVSAFDGTSPFSYNLDNLVTQPVGYFNAVGAGTHFVIVTDAMGCMDTAYFSLSQPDPISINLVLDSVSCFGGNDGGAIASSTGGTGNHNYVWFTIPAVFSPILSNRVAGNYALRVTDQNNCIKDSLVQINEPEPITVSFTTDSISCPGNKDGSILAQPSGGTMPFTFAWNNGQSGPLLINLGMGSYTVTITDVNGCKHIGTSVVGERPANSYQVFTQSPTCFNGQDGSAWVEVIQALEPVSYYWQDPAMQLTDTAVGLQAGNYVVIVEDLLGCKDTLSLTVPQTDSITLQLTASMAACTGSMDGTASVMVLSGGIAPYDYLWSDPMAQSTSTAIGLTNGTYQVTVNDSNGCTQTGSVFIDMADGVNAQITSTPTHCQSSQDGTITLVVSGGVWPYSFLWDDPTGSTDSLLTGLNPGIYHVTITTAQGCITRDSIVVDVSNGLKIDSIMVQLPSCPGSNDGELEAIIIGGSGLLTYVWSGPSVSMSNPAIGLSSGNYTLTVTDGLGCTVSSSANLPDPQAIQILLSETDVSCFGEATGVIETNVTGGTLPYSYLWSTNPQQSGPTASLLSAGNYTVTLTDANGCTAVNSAMVSEPTMPLVVQISQVSFGCAGTSANSALASVTGGTGPGYSYLWNNMDQSQQQDNLFPGLYEVTVTDQAGCVTSGQVQVTELAPIQMTLTGTEPTCYGDTDGSLMVSQIQGGTGMGISGNYSYIWNTTPMQTGQTIIGLAGEKQYQVTATDQNGCSGTSTYTLAQPVAIQAEFTITAVQCAGLDNGSISISNILGGDGNYTILWDINAGGSGNMVVNNLAAGNYSVTISDNRGCQSDSIILVTAPMPVQVSVQNKTNVRCNGESTGAIAITTSGGTGAVGYLWNTNQSTAQLSNLQAGNYQITATDSRGCSGTLAITITQPDSLELTLIGDPPDCQDKSNGFIETIVLGGTGPFAYSLNNAANVAHTVFGPLTAGLYTIMVTDANGCVDTSTIMLADPLGFSIDAGPDVTIELGESINLQVTSNAQSLTDYIWKAPYPGTLSCLNCPDPESTPRYTITYIIEGEDERGCLATDQLTVFVIQNRTVLVPTAFTPNGDGQNDKILIHGNEGTHIIIFRVFDRWGEKLYEMEDFIINDPNIGWDGTFRGADLNPGVYIWSLEVEFADGFRQHFSGQTTLLR